MPRGSHPSTVRVQRHDRRHLEIKLEHPTPPLRDSHDVDVELWLFIPQPTGISAGSYPRDLFYSDLRAYTRFKTPSVSLSSLAQLDLEGAPMAGLAIACEGLPTGEVPEALLRVIRREARLLCCVFRRAARRELQRMHAEPEAAAAIAESMSRDARAALETWRGLKERLIAADIGDATRESLCFCDEALSLEVELAAGVALSILGDGAGEGGGDAAQALGALATGERHLRRARGDRSGVLPHETGAGERMMDQVSLLKKYVSRVLFLEATPHRGAALLEQLAFSIAAGLAMLWTVGLQIGTLFLLGIELGMGVGPEVVVLFALISVGGYILKDRLKAWAGRALASAIPRLLYDRRLDLHRDDAEVAVGSVRETTGIAQFREIPLEIRVARNQIDRSPLTRWSGASVVWYRRQLTLRPREAVRSFARLEGVTEILRFDVHRWIGALDSSRKTLTLIEEGTPRQLRLHQRYVVDGVIRIQSEGDQSRMESFRIVLDRRGIVRTERPRDGALSLDSD